MKRALTQDENPKDILSKINDFIGDGESVDTLMNDIGAILKKLDSIERVMSGLKEEHYRNEVLSYVTSARNYVTSMLDAVDSMMGE